MTANRPSPRRPRQRLSLLLAGLGAGVLVAGGSAQGNEPAGEQAAPPDDLATAVSPLALALIDRVLDCAAREGPVPTDADRSLLRAAAPALAARLEAEGGYCRASEEELATACDERLREESCEVLGAVLAPPTVPAAGGDEPRWAADYADALADRVIDCAARELGREPAKAELEAAARLRDHLAFFFGSFTRVGACRPDSERLPRCLAAIEAMSCERLASQTGQGLQSFAEAMALGCRGFLSCGTPPPEPRAAPEP